MRTVRAQKPTTVQGEIGSKSKFRERGITMSTTHLLYDTGTITVPPGAGLTQIGPTLDIRKCAKIRVVAHEVLPGPAGPILIDLHVREGSISLPLAARGVSGHR